MYRFLVLIIITCLQTSCWTLRPHKTAVKEMEMHCTKDFRPFCYEQIESIAIQQKLDKAKPNTTVYNNLLKDKKKKDNLVKACVKGPVCSITCCPIPPCHPGTNCSFPLPREMFSIARKVRAKELFIRPKGSNTIHQAHVSPKTGTTTGVTIDYSAIDIPIGTSVFLELRLNNNEEVLWKGEYRLF